MTAGERRLPRAEFATRPIALEPLFTPANVITAVRGCGALALAMAALATAGFTMLVIAYAVYWTGDVADGEVARRRDEETRLGAVLDIVADRAASVLCAACFVTLRPELAVPIAIYLVEFALVDTVLSLGFLGFPVKGPNDMHLVDPTLWRWNWSRPAKALNTVSIVLLCLVGLPVLASACALVVLAVKLWSCGRLRSALQQRERVDT